MRKMYVLVRKDLAGSQPAVQAGHALAEFLLNHENHGWDNGTLIYLSVKNEDELLDWGYKLATLDVPFSSFTEPDIGDQTTAIAAVDCSEKRLSGLFKRLNLL